MRDWQDLSALKELCRLKALNGFRPHPTQSLAGLASVIHSFWEDDAGGPLSPGKEDSLLVLAVDGVSHEWAAATWSPMFCRPLTSTFPSTSTTAWLTANTGVGPDVHLVPGAVYNSDAVGGLFDCLADSPVEGAAEGTSGTSPVADPVPGYSPTVFESLAADSVECVANLCAMASVTGRWASAVVRGARVVAPSVDWRPLGSDPLAMVRAAEADIDRAVAERNKGHPLLVWTHINLDEYIHAFGYDEALVASLRRLEVAAQRWAGDGHAVLAVSDHGLVETKPEPEMVESFAAAQSPSLCRLRPGGAGRVIWSYPRRGAEEDVSGLVREAVGEEAVVIDREHLDELGLMRMNSGIRERVGEVVTLATGRRFPLPIPRRYEHGSVTEGEMFATLALWGA